MATEQEIMDELLASYGGREMRAYTPGPFEKQEQAIESFLSGIGQFAGEKEIPFLKALADPAYARNVAGNLSLGTEMTPGVGDVQAIREGAFMMGEDQPLMGSAFIAGSLFTGMSSSQLKKALEKLKKELNEKIPALRARSQSNWKSYFETGNRADEFDAARLARQADRSETRIKREIGEVEDRLKQQEFHLEVDKGRESLTEFFEGFEKFKKETGRDLLGPEGRKKLATISDLDFARMVKKYKGTKYQVEYGKGSPVPLHREIKAATETPEPKGIINATPETRKLYDDLQRGWLKDLTPEHRQLSKEMSEQSAEFNKFLDEAELDERNQLVQLMLDMRREKQTKALMKAYPMKSFPKGERVTYRPSDEAMRNLIESATGEAPPIKRTEEELIELIKSLFMKPK